MDMTSLRWALVALGVVIIAALFLFGNPDKKRKPRASRKRVHAQKVRQEPRLSSDKDEPAELDTLDVDERQTELAIEPVKPSTERHEPRFGPDDGSEIDVDEKTDTHSKSKSSVSDVPLPDKIVTLFIKARDNHIISGAELLSVALKSGLVFGDPGIFNRLNEEDNKPVFSMANLTNPGVFDKNAWNTIEIHGVTMFMTLPGPKSALDAWDSMLATSRRLAELLHADLLDDQREIFSRPRAQKIKEELREYDRQQAELS
jgi:cell division protein ZipA